MKCKVCSREWHYCSSCDSDKYWDEGVCSETCYLNSEQFKYLASQFKRLSYTKDQLNFIKELVNDFDQGIVTELIEGGKIEI